MGGACAQAALGRDREAVGTLLAVEWEAPAWLRSQPYSHAIVRELLKRERRTPALRGLAQRLGIA